MVMEMSGYEEHLTKVFLKSGHEFEREKSFSDLRGGRFRFDFYFPNINDHEVIVEADGQFHWKPIRGKKALQKQQGYDCRKNSYCLANGILLYRVPYWHIPEIQTIEDVFQSKFLVRSQWHNMDITPP